MTQSPSELVTRHLSLITPPMSKRTKAEALLVVITIIWGATFVVVKDALKDASPLAFVAVRFTLAGLLLFVLLCRGKLDRQALVPGAVLGLFLFGGFAFQTWGQKYTTPSKCAFLTGFSVILVPLITLFNGYRWRAASLAGACLGLAGIYLLVLPSGLAAINRGDVLTLLCSLSFAMHIVLVGRYTQRFSFVHLVPIQILAVAMLAAVALLFDSDRMLHWNLRLLSAFIFTAVLATGFAFSVQNWAQRYTPATHTALIFTLEPVFAAVASRLFVGEKFGGKVLLGSALILGGMVVSEVWGGSGPSPVEG